MIKRPVLRLLGLYVAESEREIFAGVSVFLNLIRYCIAGSRSVHAVPLCS